MAPRSPEAALAAARAEILHPTRYWRSPKGNGICLTFVHDMLGVGPMYGSAIEAWANTPIAQRHTSAAPAGAPEYFAVGRYGHVVVADGVRAGQEWCLSTDIKRAGKVDLVPVALIESRWGARRLGWASWLNGVPLHFPSATPAPAPAAGHTVVVGPGDTIAGITAAHAKAGTTWAQVWGAPQNSGLRARRSRPELIQPGDRVWVP